MPSPIRTRLIIVILKLNKTFNGISALQFLLLSPCAYLAFSYMVLPRLATYLDAEDCLFLRSRWIVRIFVTADVVTFLTQASGGGMAASGGDKAETGDHVSRLFGWIQGWRFGFKT